MSRDALRNVCPLLYAYGDQHAFLSTEAATGARTEERIRSIWPFLTRRVIAFQRTLKGRERVNFDAEDVLAELWAALAEKGGRWMPERGRYITFAGAVIDSELCSIRDRARTVQSPRNSSCRMKQYRAEEENGTITARRAKTADDIRRSRAGITPISGTGRDFDKQILDDPSSRIVARETADKRISWLKSALEQLVPVEADVLVRLSGILGHDREKVWQVATRIGRDEHEVRRIKAKAVEKVRQYMASNGHLADHESN